MDWSNAKTIIIPGNPIPCARPRLSTRKGVVRVHDSQSQQKSNVKLLGRISWNNQSFKHPIPGPVAVSMLFHCPVLSKSTKEERNWQLWGLTANQIKMDLDNLAKLYLDCLIGIAYVDDRQVVVLNTKKVYSLNPRTEIKIMEYETVQLSPEADEILGLIGPDGFEEIAAISAEMIQILNLLDECANEGFCPPDSFTKVAKLLSRLADNHHKSLSRISKTHPGFYLKGGV